MALSARNRLWGNLITRVPFGPGRGLSPAGTLFKRHDSKYLYSRYTPKEAATKSIVRSAMLTVSHRRYSYQNWNSKSKPSRHRTGRMDHQEPEQRDGLFIHADRFCPPSSTSAVVRNEHATRPCDGDVCRTRVSTAATAASLRNPLHTVSLSEPDASVSVPKFRCR